MELPFLRREVLLTNEQLQNIQIDPTLNPKRGDEWMRLADFCLKGELPVYYASVPLVLCVPFDLNYRPDLHPAGRRSIDAMKEEWANQRFHRLIVYPRGRWFVISDDYIQLFAALEGRPDYLPCWVSGNRTTTCFATYRGRLAKRTFAES